MMRPSRGVVHRAINGQPRQAQPKMTFVLRGQSPVTPAGQVRGAGVVVVGEVVDGELAWNGRLGRPRLERRRPTASVKGAQHPPVA